MCIHASQNSRPPRLHNHIQKLYYSFASHKPVRSLTLGHWYGTQALHFRGNIEYLDVSNTWTCTSIRHQYTSPSNIVQKYNQVIDETRNTMNYKIKSSTTIAKVLYYLKHHFWITVKKKCISTCIFSELQPPSRPMMCHDRITCQKPRATPMIF